MPEVIYFFVLSQRRRQTRLSVQLEAFCERYENEFIVPVLDSLAFTFNRSSSFRIRQFTAFQVGKFTSTSFATKSPQNFSLRNVLRFLLSNSSFLVDDVHLDVDCPFIRGIRPTGQVPGKAPNGSARPK